MLIDWDGVPVVSVSLVSRRAIEAALKPRHGGIIVDRLVTRSCANERQQTYAWKRGDVIELCAHGAYLSRIGDLAKPVLLDLDAIAEAGDENVRFDELEAQTAADLRDWNESVRTETPQFTARELDEAFDLHFRTVSP